MTPRRETEAFRMRRTRAATRQQLQLSGKGSLVLAASSAWRVRPPVSLSGKGVHMPTARPQPRAASTFDALGDKIPDWWTPPVEMLQRVRAAANAFDARQATRQKHAESLRVATSPRVRAGHMVTSGIPISTWTSPSAASAESAALFECTANRYVSPFRPVSSMFEVAAEEAGMEWTRPAWWPDGAPPARDLGASKFPSVMHRLEEAVSARIDALGGYDAAFGGKGAHGGRLGGPGAKRGGVVAAVRMSTDGAASSGGMGGGPVPLPPTTASSLPLDAADTHADVFKQLA